MAFLNSEDEEYSDAVNQQENSVMAIGSGQLTGKGLNNNEVASANKGNFVSENQTDFIFSVAGEELGFIGCVAILLLLLLIIFECIRTSLRAKDMAGKLICCGVASIVAVQGFINVAVVTKILPNTGTPLPFEMCIRDRIFVEAGAPEEILYQQKPHLGTDTLINIVKNIRSFIEQAGGEIRFSSKMTDLKIKDGRRCV